MAASRLRLALWYGLALVAILLFAVLPVLLAIGSSIVADMAGCQVDEGSRHPCIVMGSDIGDDLQFFFVVGWFSLMTIPAGGAALLIWAAVFIAHFVTRRLKRAA